MRSNKSGLVGLITGAISLSPSRADVSGLPDLFIVQGIQKAMEASGKTLLIADTGGQSDRVPQLIRTFEEHRVEGIIYVADQAQAWVEEIKAGQSVSDIMQAHNIPEGMIWKSIRLAFLSPEVLKAIAQGKTNRDLTIKILTQRELPLDWSEQQALFLS